MSGEIQAGYSISQPVTVNGPGARTLTINGTGGYSGFYVQGTGNVTISGLTIAHCGPPGSNSGGAILKTGAGQLTLLDCDLRSNAANDALGGGAIFNDIGSTLVLTRCTFFENTTNRAGGALYNLGIATLTNCTIGGNDALNGGAIISKANGGASSLTLRNCTLLDNASTDPNTGRGKWRRRYLRGRD